jgi:hypothetical protein
MCLWCMERVSTGSRNLTPSLFTMTRSLTTMRSGRQAGVTINTPMRRLDLSCDSLDGLAMIGGGDAVNSQCLAVQDAASLAHCCKNGPTKSPSFQPTKTPTMSPTSSPTMNPTPRPTTKSQRKKMGMMAAMMEMNGGMMVEG